MNLTTKSTDREVLRSADSLHNRSRVFGHLILVRNTEAGVSQAAVNTTAPGVRDSKVLRKLRLVTEGAGRLGGFDHGQIEEALWVRRAGISHDRDGSAEGAVEVRVPVGAVIRIGVELFHNEVVL